MPRFYDFFNSPIHPKALAAAKAAPGPADAAPPGGTPPTPPTQGVFITPQSIITFPVASFVVGLIWKTGGFLTPFLASPWVCLVIALVIAFLIWYITTSDPAVTATSRDKAIGFAIAAINGFYLFGSTVGITTVLNVAPTHG